MASFTTRPNTTSSIGGGWAPRSGNFSIGNTNSNPSQISQQSTLSPMFTFPSRSAWSTGAQNPYGGSPILDMINNTGLGGINPSIIEQLIRQYGSQNGPSQINGGNGYGSPQLPFIW